ncbi:hypothetical protein QYF36_017855 [Acer negundo]|nr:hypothetical protein QYF36_017855 [Acer negundo]
MAKPGDRECPASSILLTLLTSRPSVHASSFISSLYYIPSTNLLFELLTTLKKSEQALRLHSSIPPKSSSPLKGPNPYFLQWCSNVPLRIDWELFEATLLRSDKPPSQLAFLEYLTNRRFVTRRRRPPRLARVSCSLVLFTRVIHRRTSAWRSIFLAGYLLSAATAIPVRSSELDVFRIV